MWYDIGSYSHPGNCRDTNQDSFLVCTGNVEKKNYALLAVADGMGGMEKGEEASALAVKYLEQWWYERLPEAQGKTLNWLRIKDSLVITIDQINWSIYTRADNREGRSGTTLTLAFVCQNEFMIMHVGDSRAYTVKNSMASQLTKDQTWCQQELDEGRLTKSVIANHPNRHALISALGVEPHYRLEKFRGIMENGLFLCSDGFYNCLDEGNGIRFSTHKSAQKMLEIAADQVLRGVADDNLTGVLLITKPFGWAIKR